MKWSQEAEKLISKVPLFVKKRVKKRVEQVLAEENVIKLVKFYKDKSLKGERFGEVLKKNGVFDMNQGRASLNNLLST